MKRKRRNNELGGGGGLVTTGNYDGHSFGLGVSEYMTSILAENFINSLLKIVAEKKLSFENCFRAKLPTGSTLSKTNTL